MDRRPLVLWGVVLLAGVRGETAEAVCVAPRPEPPRLLQPASLPVAPGQSVVLYLSSAARRSVFVLQPASGQGGASVALALEPIAANVFRARIPAQVSPGSYEVASQIGRGAPRAVGRITVGARPASAAPGPVAGRVEYEQGESTRGGRFRVLRFRVDSRSLVDAVVVFRWGRGSSERASAVWLTGDRTLLVASAGRCGVSPFDSGGPPGPGESFEAAQLGADGAPGPWTAYGIPAR
jgi:hypothetical protein